MNNGGKIAKGEAADNGSKFAETPSPGLMAVKLMDDAESLILIGFQRLYINSLFCHGTHLFKLTGSDGIYLG